MSQAEHIDRYPLVYIPEVGEWGTVVQTGAHVSKVLYFMDGLRYEEYFENSELINRREVNILYYEE